MTIIAEGLNQEMIDCFFSNDILLREWAEMVLEVSGPTEHTEEFFDWIASQD